MTRNQFRIVDCAQNDQPRYRAGAKREEGVSAVSFGIIGGASGPTTIILDQTSKPTVISHTAMSPLHFEPVETIEWRIAFLEKPNADLTVSLI